MDQIVKELYGNDVRLSRIYHCKDGRKRIDLIASDWRKTIQYAKLVLEVKLGRKLIGDETVDHINGDKTDDSPDNVRVMSLSENARDSQLILQPQSYNCPLCNVTFTLVGKKVKDAVNNRKKGKAGPFCGRSCAGKYGAERQNGRTEALEINTTMPARFYKNGKGYEKRECAGTGIRT